MRGHAYKFLAVFVPSLVLATVPLGTWAQSRAGEVTVGYDFSQNPFYDGWTTPHSSVLPNVGTPPLGFSTDFENGTEQFSINHEVNPFTNGEGLIANGVEPGLDQRLILGLHTPVYEVSFYWLQDLSTTAVGTLHVFAGGTLYTQSATTVLFSKAGEKGGFFDVEFDPNGPGVQGIQIDLIRQGASGNEGGFAIDNLVFGVGSPVPEPSSLILSTVAMASAVV